MTNIRKNLADVEADIEKIKKMIKNQNLPPDAFDQNIQALKKLREAAEFDAERQKHAIQQSADEKKEEKSKKIPLGPTTAILVAMKVGSKEASKVSVKQSEKAVDEKLSSILKTVDDLIAMLGYRKDFILAEEKSYAKFQAALSLCILRRVRVDLDYIDEIIKYTKDKKTIDIEDTERDLFQDLFKDKQIKKIVVDRIVALNLKKEVLKNTESLLFQNLNEQRNPLSKLLGKETTHSIDTLKELKGPFETAHFTKEQLDQAEKNRMGEEALKQQRHKK